MPVSSITSINYNDKETKDNYTLELELEIQFIKDKLRNSIYTNQVGRRADLTRITILEQLLIIIRQFEPITWDV